MHEQCHGGTGHDRDGKVVIGKRDQLYGRASGRHGAGDAWLAAIGAQPAEQQSSPCGIFYTSRFYQLKDGADYPQLDGRKSTAGGVQGVDLGYLKVGLFRADNRTFSITLAADPEDKPMRAVSQEREFDLAVEQIDATKAWVEPATSVPISKVYLYGNLSNVHKRFVRDGVPVASIISRSATRTCTRIRFPDAAARSAGFAHSNSPTCSPHTTTPCKRAVEFEARIDARIAAVVSAAGGSGQTIDRHQQGAAARRRSVFVRQCRRFDRRSANSDSRSSAKESAQPRASIWTYCARCSVTPICSTCRDALFARQDLLGKILTCYEQHKNEETKLRPTARRDAGVVRGGT